VSKPLLLTAVVNGMEVNRRKRPGRGSQHKKRGSRGGYRAIYPGQLGELWAVRERPDRVVRRRSCESAV